jgi:hypothetical protein
MKRGKRKKQPKLDTVKKLATAIKTNDGTYRSCILFDFMWSLKQSPTQN